MNLIDFYPIKGTNRYEINREGQVFDFKNARFLMQNFTGGYKAVSLCIDGKHVRHYIHRLLAKTFIPNPGSLDCVHHIDGNKQNNALSNLQWIGRGQHSRMHRCKFNETDIKAIFRLSRQGYLQREIASIYDVVPQTIWRVLNGKTYQFLNIAA
ncbi:MAG: HNH endonuclease [Cyanobacteria bacterium J06636_27]